MVLRFSSLSLSFPLYLFCTAIIIPVGEKWIRTTAEENALQSLVD